MEVTMEVIIRANVFEIDWLFAKVRVFSQLA